MTTTMTTTMTISRPARTVAPSIATSAPQRMSAPTLAAGWCCAAVSVAGRLSVLDAATSATGGFPNSRRTATGTVYRIDLDGGITCWLDGDHQDGSGELNPAATHICTTLSSQPFTDPWDAPFVCGPVLFTGTDAGRPGALTDAQLARLLDAYASHETDPDHEHRDEPDLTQDLAFDAQWAW